VSCQLVTALDRRQHIEALALGSLGDGERYRRERRTRYATILRRPLSSDAAASLISAFVRATPTIGSFSPGANQTDACGRPPATIARSRMIRAALATLLG
jgi:hypothetical protein